MTFTGDWLQAPDYTGTGRIIGGALVDGATVTTERTMPPQTVQPDAAMTDAIPLVPATLTVEPAAPGGLWALVDVGVSHAYLTEPTGTVFGVGGRRGGLRWSADEQRATWPAPQWPPGVVAVEYESTTATVLDASGAWTYNDESRDTSAGSDAHQPVSGIGRVSVHDLPTGVLLFEQTLLGNGQASTGTAALSPYMVGSDGIVTLEAYLHKTGTFSATDADWGYSDARDSAGAAVSGTKIGGAYTVTITYTLRPPRHRFVYEQAPVKPPTRIFPRDDGLLTSSAARVWPPPRSRQKSNRRGPGSYE